MKLISNRTDLCFSSSASPTPPSAPSSPHLSPEYSQPKHGAYFSGFSRAAEVKTALTHKLLFKQSCGFIRKTEKKRFDVCLGRQPTRHSRTCRRTLPHVSTVHLLCCVATGSLGTGQASAEATPPKRTHTQSHTSLSPSSSFTLTLPQ